MKFDGFDNIFKESSDYSLMLSEIKNNKIPCQVHGLSESQKAYVAYCLFEDIQRNILIISYNDMEAKKIYDDLKVFTDNCLYVPVKEVALNIDATSGDIKSQRMRAIGQILDGTKRIVVASVDAFLYRMMPPEILRNSLIHISSKDTVDVLALSSKLIDIGYEKVDIVEGKGQFARRGGIIDVFSIDSDEPYRIEFFDDEIDTIRTFDIMSQRSHINLSEAYICPANEVIIDSEKAKEAAAVLKNECSKKYKYFLKKNEGMAERLKDRYDEVTEKIVNLRHFEGIDSLIGYIYKDNVNFLSYFKNCRIIMDESGRVSNRIDSAFNEFKENYKSLLEKGEIIPGQGEYMIPPDEIKSAISEKLMAVFNMLPRTVEDFKPLSIVTFDSISVNPISGNFDILLEAIKDKINRMYRVVMLAATPARCERLVSSLKDEGITAVFEKNIGKLKPGVIAVTTGAIKKGMEFPDIKAAMITEGDTFSEKKARKRTFSKKGKRIQDFTDLKVGDYVVHVNHGIGQFKGIKELIIEGIKKDYLVLQYQGGDTLYVPVEQLDMIQKYVGSGEASPRVNKLGGVEWAKTKKKVKESLKEMAGELIKLYAARSTIQGHAFSPDTPWQKQFEDEFPYQETADQITAIEDIKKDMESIKPMDRLLCGDVGYGKTEVAMRAAFKAVMDGKQVAVLVPTTILAEQHYNNFSQRFADFPVKVDMVSRFRTREQQKSTIKNIAAGNVDIIIGTHRLLQKDIKYKDLGLLIVDEEQRFGVTHKEKIKELKKNIDVLTLTATPIPRTLHMSLIGARDMSIIETPPLERYPVQTYVMEYNEEAIADAIMREVSRGGQVFFVYNRVETIMDMQSALSKIVPEAKIVVGHGQMNEKELEDVILDFVAGNGDILLCTTIIETGIDMPNVNTLIVYDADKMGLSQLYQLRGRVGRSNRLAYSYFTYRKDKILNEIAEKRLKAIKEFTEFGSGFKIAIRDLEIRGAGNLLGKQQHGHMAAVGYDMYCKLLEESVHELKGEKVEEYNETSIELSVNAYIPDTYIQDEVLKIEIYKKIASIENDDDKMDIEDEIIDRFGDIPGPVVNLINIAYLKSKAKKLSISDIKQEGKEVLLYFRNKDYINIDDMRQINEKMDDIITYGSGTQPIIKIKTGNKSNNDLILLIKEFIENMSSLHNDKK